MIETCACGCGNILDRDWDANERPTEAAPVQSPEPTERQREIHALEKALEAARTHAQRARREVLDEDTCRFWSGVSGWLRSRIRALEAGEEPDWPDAANTAATDLGVPEVLS